MKNKMTGMNKNTSIPSTGIIWDKNSYCRIVQVVHCTPLVELLELFSFLCWTILVIATIIRNSWHGSAS